MEERGEVSSTERLLRVRRGAGITGGREDVVGVQVSPV